MSKQIPKSMILPGYGVALLLVAFPIADFLTSAWPLQPGRVEWRYGTVGLFAGFLLTPLLGLVLAVVVAHAANHIRTVKALAVLSVVAAVTIVVALVSFALDVTQLRGGVEEAARGRFDAGAISASIKYALVAIVLAWFGIGHLRSARGKVKGRDSAPLVRKS